MAAGGRLGVGNDPRYNKTRCFEPFPFPNLADHPTLLAATAEELDAHRKRQQAAHTSLTLTDMYNVLDALRLGRVLSAKEKIMHSNGLLSVPRWTSVATTLQPTRQDEEGRHGRGGSGHHEARVAEHAARADA